MEPYLLVIKNKENRRNICKLRCGNHHLAIETGRLKKIPIEERVCTRCENKVEDELHFLTECELFDIVREKFLNDIIEIDPNLKTDDRKLMFISLLTTTNCLILNKLSAFINACFEIRRIFKEVKFKWKSIFLIIISFIRKILVHTCVITRLLSWFLMDNFLTALHVNSYVFSLIWGLFWDPSWPQNISFTNL